MKTIRLILIAALIIPLTLMAQKGPFDKIFEKYSDSEDVTSVMISMDGIKINFGQNNEASEIFDLMNQVDKINILKFENRYKSFQNSDFFKEVNSIINQNDYEQLVDIKSKDENVRVYIIQGEEGIVKEGLIIVNKDDEAAIISVRGNMNPSDFLNIHSHMTHFYSKHNNSERSWEHY